MREAHEPVLVQALVAESAVERLDVRVLIRLARLDMSQRDAMTVCSSEHRLARELRGWPTRTDQRLTIG
jgi:hypothetical protein